MRTTVQTVLTYVTFGYGSWANAVISLVAIAVFAALLGPATLGAHALLVVCCGLASEFLCLGGDQFVVRRYREVGLEEFASDVAAAMALPLIAAGGASLVALLFAQSLFREALGSEWREGVLGIAIAVAVLGSINRYAWQILRMRERGHAISLLQVLAGTSLLLVPLGLIATGLSDVRALLLGNITSVSVTLCGAFFVESGLFKAVLASFRHVKRQSVREALRFGWPFVPTTILDWFSQQADKLVVQYFTGLEALGAYSVAQRFAGYMNLAHAGFSMYWVPHFYRIHAEGVYTGEQFRKAFLWVSCFMLSFAIASLAVLAFIHPVYPRQYVEGLALIPIFALSHALLSVSYVTYVGIDIRKETRLHIVVAVLSAAILVVLAPSLVPRFGILGGAVSLLAASAATLFTRSWLSFRLMPVSYPWFRFATAVCAVILFAAIAIADNVIDRGTTFMLTVAAWISIWLLLWPWQSVRILFSSLKVLR